jgi:NAD+--dinitrogen-reductase ADP-D-ribosyltransferase
MSERGGRHPTVFNLCNLPPWVIASRQFVADPQPIEIQGVRDGNTFLFKTLDAIEAPAERARRFDDYLSVKFQLHHWQQESQLAGRSIKNSYLRYLRGWGVDSSSIEGAVLKGWVESRMGIAPTYHRGKLSGSEESESDTRYAIDRMKGAAFTNAINAQLDLVYAYMQYELARRFPAQRWITLWRGVNDAEDHEVIERTGKREMVVRLNNICSFTDDQERAWEFGSTVWETQVPIPRIFFVSEFFPRSILKGEREYLVIGGETPVRQVIT